MSEKGLVLAFFSIFLFFLSFFSPLSSLPFFLCPFLFAFPFSLSLLFKPSFRASCHLNALFEPSFQVQKDIKTVKAENKTLAKSLGLK